MKKKLLISFSGGKSSGYMTKLLLDSLDPDEWEIIVVFANTGKEREETFQFIEDCDRYFGFNTIWVEAVVNPEYRKGTKHKVVTRQTAARSGEPFEDMLQKYGIPNICCKHCTRELKIKPIHSYVKNELGWQDYYTAIGIRYDEARRVDKDREKKKFIYPLVFDYQATRYDVNEFWMKQIFTLNLKSYEDNCDLCVEKAEKKLITILKEDIGIADWWIKMERRYENYIPPGRNQNAKTPFRFFRNNRSIHDLIRLSQLPFKAARDESRDVCKVK